MPPCSSVVWLFKGEGRHRRAPQKQAVNTGRHAFGNCQTIESPHGNDWWDELSCEAQKAKRFGWNFRIWWEPSSLAEGDKLDRSSYPRHYCRVLLPIPPTVLPPSNSWTLAVSTMASLDSLSYWRNRYPCRAVYCRVQRSNVLTRLASVRKSGAKSGFNQEKTTERSEEHLLET